MPGKVTLPQGWGAHLIGEGVAETFSGLSRPALACSHWMSWEQFCRPQPGDYTQGKPSGARWTKHRPREGLAEGRGTSRSRRCQCPYQRGMGRLWPG